MSEQKILPKVFGRGAFGGDPEGYERARPAYPEAVYERLRARCGLKRGIAALEIGPGPGMVTKRLLEAGAAVTVVEPDARLGVHLRARFAGAPLTVVESSFEDAVLQAGAFDLAVAATSFHWVDRAVGVAKAADALKPGGWWAAWWSFFSDRNREDDFSKAIAHLFKDVPRNHDIAPNGDTRPFGLQEEMRVADLKAEPRFADVRSEIITWEVTMSAEQVCAMFASFSPIVSLSEGARVDFLAKLGAVVREQFGDALRKTMTAALYTARRV